LERYGGGYTNYLSTGNVWRVYDRDENLLLSIGVRANNEFAYLYKDKTGQNVTGVISSLGELKSIIDKVGG
jgi:hypothetical protein